MCLELLGPFPPGSLEEMLLHNEYTRGNYLFFLQILTNCYQRMYFLRKLKYFHVNDRILFLFYQSIIQSTITFDSIIWYSNAKQSDKHKLRRVVKQASKIMNHTVDL